MGDRDRRAETAERTATRARRARELRSLLVDQLAAVIGRGAQVGFLDFPFHTNPEDAMIFEGTMSAFAELSIDVVRLSDQAAYRRDDYASLPADTTMVFHGGGNFGDLFPGIHDQRLAEMVDLADFPLVVMPQTLTYATDAGLAETRRIVASLPRLTLLWRDASSLARATDLFPTARSLLVPDAAFGLAPSPRRRSRGPLRVEVLARNDASSSGLHLVDADPWPVADWRYRRTGWGPPGSRWRSIGRCSSGLATSRRWPRRGRPAGSSTSTPGSSGPSPCTVGSAGATPWWSIASMRGSRRR